MIYSKLGILVMFLFSLLGLYTGVTFLDELFISILGFLVFIETTFIYSECIYNEYKYRKQERARLHKDRPVIILHSITSSLTKQAI
jgi:hypothetical protein